MVSTKQLLRFFSFLSAERWQKVKCPREYEPVQHGPIMDILRFSNQRKNDSNFEIAFFNYQ